MRLGSQIIIVILYTFKRFADYRLDGRCQMTARDDFFFYFRLKRTADLESRLQIILIRPAASLRRDPIRRLRRKDVSVLA